MAPAILKVKFNLFGTVFGESRDSPLLGSELGQCSTTGTALQRRTPLVPERPLPCCSLISGKDDPKSPEADNNRL